MEINTWNIEEKNKYYGGKDGEVQIEANWKHVPAKVRGSKFELCLEGQICAKIEYKLKIISRERCKSL